MRDYIKEIADKLTIGNTPVILYGAGLDSVSVIAESSIAGTVVKFGDSVVDTVKAIFCGNFTHFA
ncbi:hypothetical protein FACS1894216_18320 [Synergistales bacterium]|nr:hypothetical protein FACS1894216_18320 [Synergistales bacterium]